MTRAAPLPRGHVEAWDGRQRERKGSNQGQSYPRSLSGELGPVRRIHLRGKQEGIAGAAQEARRPKRWFGGFPMWFYGAESERT